MLDITYMGSCKIETFDELKSILVQAIGKNNPQINHLVGEENYFTKNDGEDFLLYTKSPRVPEILPTMKFSLTKVNIGGKGGLPTEIVYKNYLFWDKYFGNFKGFLEVFNNINLEVLPLAKNNQLRKFFEEKNYDSLERHLFENGVLGIPRSLDDF